MSLLISLKKKSTQCEKLWNSSFDRELENLEERCRYNKKRRLVEFRENIARKLRKRAWI